MVQGPDFVVRRISACLEGGQLTAANVEAGTDRRAQDPVGER